MWIDFVLKDKHFKVFVVSVWGLLMLIGKACKRGSITSLLSHTCVRISVEMKVFIIEGDGFLCCGLNLHVGLLFSSLSSSSAYFSQDGSVKFWFRCQLTST